MKFIKREIEPHMLKVAGGEYPAIFSYRAISEIEEITGIQYTYTLFRLDSEYDENGILVQDIDGDIPNLGLTTRETAGIVFGMLKAAGVDVTYQDLLDSVTPSETIGLIKQIKSIIKYQDIDYEKEKDGDPKNVVPLKKGKK